MLDPILEQRMDVIAEEIFGTQNDQSQIPINRESAQKLDKLSPNWILYKLDAKGDPVSWVIVMPTTRDIAKQFLANKITERDLLDMTVPQKEYSALYLCSAITIPEYRRRGIVVELVKDLIQKIPKTSDCILFAWPFSDEGNMLINKLQDVLGKEILIKDNNPHL